MMKEGIRIGEAAKRVGIPPKTIRYYEEIGLIDKLRRREGGWASPGQRLFTQKDLDRLAFIKRAKLLDFSLAEIKELLTLIENGCCGTVRPQLRSLIVRKLGEIEVKIKDLHQMKGNLQTLVKAIPISRDQKEEARCGASDEPSSCITGDFVPLPLEKT